MSYILKLFFAITFIVLFIINSALSKPIKIIVLGDNHNFLIAVIVPVREKIEELASIHHISYNSYKELLEKYTTYEVVENDLKNYQTDLAQYEQIKKFILIEKPFTIENGSLTPSMKIKRKVVEDKFINEINLLYE
jgi:long-chain acyl-CoA synthetase